MISPDGRLIFSEMSVAEISKSIARLTPEQQAVVVQFVSKVRGSNSPARRRQLSTTMQAMDAGEKFSWTDVKKARATGLMPKR
ncbi:MAG: hypothetical protein RLZZ15_2410 [Verrucomicrobiota bacterium]